MNLAGKICGHAAPYKIHTSNRRAHHHSLSYQYQTRVPSLELGMLLPSRSCVLWAEINSTENSCTWSCWIYFWKQNYICVSYSMIPHHWSGMGCWNPPSWNRRFCVSCKNKTMPCWWLDAERNQGISSCVNNPVFLKYSGLLEHCGFSTCGAETRLFQSFKKNQAVFASRFENLLARNSSIKIFKHEKEEKLAGLTGNFAGPAPFLVAVGLGPALNAKTDQDNIIVADALAPCITRASAAKVLNMPDLLPAFIK